MNYILFDDTSRNNLLPLTFLKPIADLRIGVLSIREKWEKYLKAKTSSLTEEYLSAKYPIKKAKKNMLINGSICPNETLIKEILSLKPNQALVNEDSIIAYNIVVDNDIENFNFELTTGIEHVETKTSFIKLNNVWDIFKKNDVAIEEDFKLLSKDRKSAPVDSSVKIIGDINKLFIEEGAKVYHSIINTSTGPVYIGKNAEIMENASIRGPFALCENSTIKMGAKIYGATTIGPHSKAGGEINNSVITGYSNKAHDGFLGNSVIGEWCNLGADTNNSNLKNNYDNIKLWNYNHKRFIDTGLQFCGLFMGDHSKCGINTMFNTGTVIGVNCNIYGAGFHRNFISSFSWGGVAGFAVYKLEKAIETAERVYKRRNKEFNEVEKDIFTSVFNQTFEYRKL